MEEIVRKRKTELGCIGPDRPSFYRLWDGTSSGRCPRTYQKGPLWEYLKAYLWQEKCGLWPVAGGLLDQPAKVVDAFTIIRGCMMQIEEKRREEAK